MFLKDCSFSMGGGFTHHKMIMFNNKSLRIQDPNALKSQLRGGYNNLQAHVMQRGTHIQCHSHVGVMSKGHHPKGDIGTQIMLFNKFVVMNTIIIIKHEYNPLPPFNEKNQFL
jgi:hypothetical protein